MTPGQIDAWTVGETAPEGAASTTPAVPDDAAVSGWSDDELVQAAAVIAAEQRARAISRCDPDALVELGFTDGFRSDGLPRDPWVVSGMIVCAGGRRDRSASAHDCAFVSIDDTWVWEHPDTVADIVRAGAGPRRQLRAVSLVPALEGLEIDLVTSQMRNGVHQLRDVRSFVVRDGSLALVAARTRRVDHGR